MSQRPEPLVVAEILLHRSGKVPDARDRALEFLRDRGVEVSAVGAASVSIRCARTLFESVFDTALEEEPPAAPPPKGVKDFGPAPGLRYRATRPILVPPEIADAVESVVLEPPSRYFR